MPNDLSGLSPELQATARFTNSGREVMWPRDDAELVINALADQGKKVLGLDLRSDGEGTTPPGLATEVPWSDFRPDPSSVDGEVEDARRQALEALHRPGLADFDEYPWVLVTW
jgi:hypothetical protein